MSSSSGRNQSSQQKVSHNSLTNTTSSLLPYLTIHMQSIGLTVEEIAIIYLALPFTTFLSPPITGFLVDKFGKYKPVVVMSLLLNAIFHHSLLFIPQQEIPGVVPSAFVMRHPDSGDIEKPLGSCEITPYLKKFKMEWMPSVIYGRNNISLLAVLSASLDPTNPVAIVKPSSSSKTNFKCLRSETRVQRMLKQSEHANG
ncbi:hypothetical protein GQX74_010229 [Glossina fuscipes]|nr:hypothetical protein GQX74_010229 [Glossina fuscipes]